MIAVTTHSRAKRLRHMLPLLVAGKTIEHQLKAADGCERYANVIAGPREFWTLSLWRDGGALRKTMRTGAHGSVMGKQPDWLSSYWGMRWRSSETTSGRWPGKPLQSCAETTTGGSDADETDFRLPVWMQAALGKTVPLERRQVAGVAGATYRLHVAPWALPAALRDLKRVRRIAAGDPDHVRGAIGIGTGRAVYLMIVTTSGDAIERLRAHPEHRRVLERWGDRLWLSTWEPEAEFGQWHKVRLRDGQLASERPVVDVTLAMQPEAAKRARDVLRANLSGIGPERLGMLELLTSEVVGNSFRHGRLNSTDPIRLQIAAKGEWLRVAVIDRGRKFEPRVPTAKFSTDQSGWGLYIVDKTTDRWGIFTRQNERHFWFELRLSSLDCAPPGSA